VKQTASSITLAALLAPSQGYPFPLEIVTRWSLTAPDGHGFEQWQDASFGWIQLFTGLGPAGRPRGTLAVEPMTCPPDAFRSGEPDHLAVARPVQRELGVSTF
jgi:hypothetical protein